MTITINIYEATPPFIIAMTNPMVIHFVTGGPLVVVGQYEL